MRVPHVRSFYCHLRQPTWHIGSGRLDEGGNNNDRRKRRISPARKTATISATTATSNVRSKPSGRRYRRAELKTGRVELDRLIDRPLDVCGTFQRVLGNQKVIINDRRQQKQNRKSAVSVFWSTGDVTAWKTSKRQRNLFVLWAMHLGLYATELYCSCKRLNGD